MLSLHPFTFFKFCFCTFLMLISDRGVRHGAPRHTRFRNPLDFMWISDFRTDFWISKWISGFQSGFLDLKVDFWISSRFLDFIWTAIIVKIQLKCTHDPWTAFLSAYTLTEYSYRLLQSAQTACSLIVIHVHAMCVRWLLYIFICIMFVVIHIHTILCVRSHSYIMHLQLQLHHLRRMTFVPNRRSAGYKGLSLWWHSITP